VTLTPGRTALLATTLLIVVTGALAIADVSPSTPWRHLYLAPVVLIAVRFGVAGGLLAALGTALALGRSCCEKSRATVPRARPQKAC